MEPTETTRYFLFGIGAALGLSLSAIDQSEAADNPFAMTELSSGFLVAGSAEGKCGEGKCGEGKGAHGHGPNETIKEGKCGEGKCGEGKCGADKGAHVHTKPLSPEAKQR